MMTLGRKRVADFSSASYSISPVLSSSRYGIVSKYTDTIEIFLVSVWKPCRWPPCGRSRPMMRSCSLQMAEKAAKLAGEPDSVCTLTPHFAGSARKACSARLRHRSSAMSMNSLLAIVAQAGSPQSTCCS